MDRAVVPGVGPSRLYASELGKVQAPARELAATMDLDANAAFITEQMMQIVFPDRLDDQAFREMLARTAYDNLDTMWRIIAGRAELEANPPYGAIAFSDTAAAIGVPLSQFERIYRVGTGLVWTLWYRASVGYTNSHDDVTLEDLLGGPSMIIHAYIDGQISSMLSRYENAQAEHLRTREALKLSVLRQVLDDAAVLGRAEISDALGIGLDDEHLAVAVRVDRDPADTGLADRLTRIGDAAPVLVYRHGVRLWLIWISRPKTFDAATCAELRATLERAGVPAALGTPGRGLDALGASGRDALEAARLQDMLGDAAPGVVSFDDLRLESLFLNDPERARRFVRDELGDLDTDDTRTAALRDTAQIWLTSGSHVSTASRLGIHEHTVRNRVAQIEALVGCSITNRRTELLVALRLRKLLDTPA